MCHVTASQPSEGMTRGRLGPAAPRLLRWPALLLVLVLCRIASSAVAEADGSCTAGDSDPAEVLDSPSLGRPLRPSDLRGPSAFGSFVNSTLDLPGGSRQNVSMGRVRQDGGEGEEDMVDFAVLPSVVDRPDVEELLALLRGYEDWDDDPDSVDGSECSRLSNML